MAGASCMSEGAGAEGDARATAILAGGAARATAIRTLPLGSLVVSTFALAWVANGSIAAVDWLPYAVLCALALGMVLLSGAAQAPPRTALAALAALVSLAALAGISAGWSAVPTLARDESLLTAAYAVAFVLPLLVLRSREEATVASAVAAAGLLALALATATELLARGNAPDLFEEGRLNFPIAYANAQAALFLLGFWPAVVLAARPGTRRMIRAVSVGAAAALGSAALIAQSKGSVIGLAVSAIVLFAVSPLRLRLLVPTFIAAALVALAAAPLTAPFRAHGPAELDRAIRHAGLAVLIVAVAGIAAGWAYVLADSRLELSERGRRRAGRVAGLATGLALLAALAAFLVVVHHPERFFADKWHQFKTPPAQETGGTHLFVLGSYRYDVWRVALGEFRDHPVAGVGARGFGPAYLRDGGTSNTPARAHSLPLEVLCEEGILGFLLLAGAVGIPLALAARGARRGYVAATSALASGSYWLAHSLVDWLWTFPALGIPFFLLLALGAVSGRQRARLAGRVSWPAGGAVLAVALLAFAPPWLSAKLTSKAVDGKGSATTELRWARRLDPLSTDPLVARAQLASSPARAVAALDQAVRKEPRSAALRYLLGVALLDAGRRRDARLQLQRAHELAPRDELIAGVLQRAREQHSRE